MSPAGPPARSTRPFPGDSGSDGGGDVDGVVAVVVGAARAAVAARAAEMREQCS